MTVGYLSPHGKYISLLWDKHISPTFLAATLAIIFRIDSLRQMGTHYLCNMLIGAAYNMSLATVLSLTAVTQYGVNSLSTSLQQEADLAAMYLQIAWRQKQAV